MNDSIKFFPVRLIYYIKRRKNRIWKYLSTEKISRQGLAFPTSKDEFFDRLSALLGTFNRSVFSAIDKDVCDRIVQDANLICQHKFSLLGSGIVEFNKIPWNKDFKSGYEWPIGTFYMDYRGYPAGTDIKVPWELSRSHHLLWLGEAFLLTDDEKYAEEIVIEIKDWIDTNPLMCSVNWTCSMDVAIRAVNWMYALSFISSYVGIDEAFVKKVTYSLAGHLFYIKNNLEKTPPYSNNHYVANLAGLLFLTGFFEANKCYKRTLKEYYSEIRKQVLCSGVHYERSLSYHRLVTELFSYTYYMLARRGEKIPVDIRDRIQRMYDFVSNYTMPNGLAPQIGDNDDGRFLPFLKRDFGEHAYLNDENSVELRLASRNVQDVFWSKYKQSKYYEDAGFVIYRKEGIYLFVSDSEYSKIPDMKATSVPTHTHNDALSIVLNVAGIDIIVDPGSYVYTSNKAERNHFRSTAMHNTVIVDMEEQNQLPSSRMFFVNMNINNRQLTMNENSILGSYETMQGKTLHVREIKLHDGSIIIKDRILKKNNQKVKSTFCSNYHLAAGLMPFQSEKGVIVPVGVKEFVISSNLEASIEDDYVSESYGRLKRSKTLVYVTNFIKECIVETTIKWA